MMFQKEEKMSLRLLTIVREIFRKQINIEWNEYELDTIADLTLRLFEAWGNHNDTFTHLELYEIVAWDLVCAPSTIQNRVKKVKDKVMKVPFIQGMLIATNVDLNSVSYEMFFKMLMNTVSIVQHASGTFRLEG